MSVIDLKGRPRLEEPDGLRPESVREEHPDLGDLLVADRERDENAGFLESSGRVTGGVDPDEARRELASESPLRSKRRRRKGAALDSRLSSLEGVFSEAELESIEELIESASKSAAGGFLGSKEIFENLMDKITEALKGGFPLELYIRSELEKVARELGATGGRRANQLARLLRDLFGDDAELVMAYMRHGLADRIRALVVHYESAPLSTEPSAQTSRRAPNPWNHSLRLVRLYERALVNGRQPGTLSEPLDELSRAAVSAELAARRLDWRRGETGDGADRRRSDALVRESVESLRKRIADERERLENAGYLESARRGPSRAVGQPERSRAGWPTRATQIYVGPFRHRGSRAPSLSLEESWMASGERVALAALIESFKKAQGPGQLAHDTLVNLAEAILEAARSECPLELLVSSDHDRVQMIFAEIAVRRMAQYRRLLKRRYQRRGEEIFERLEAEIAERVGGLPAEPES